LNIDPSCHPITLIEPPKKWKIEEKSKISKELFNHFNVSGVCFVNSIDLLLDYYDIVTCTVVFIHKGMKCVVSIENKTIKEFIELENKKSYDGKIRKRVNLSFDEVSKEIDNLKDFKKPLIVSIGDYDKNSHPKSALYFIDLLKKKYTCEVFYEHENMMKAGISFSNGQNFISSCEYNPIHETKKINFKDFQNKVTSVIATQTYDGDGWNRLHYKEGDIVYIKECDDGDRIGGMMGKQGRIFNDLLNLMK